MLIDAVEHFARALNSTGAHHMYTSSEAILKNIKVKSHVKTDEKR